MKVKDLVVNLLGIDPELEVFVYFPDGEDDYPISEVEEMGGEQQDDYVRLSFRV